MEKEGKKCEKCHIKDCPLDDTCNAPIKEYCPSLVHTTSPLPQKEKCEFCNAPFQHHHKQNELSGKLYHSSCLERVKGDIATTERYANKEPAKGEGK